MKFRLALEAVFTREGPSSLAEPPEPGKLVTDSRFSLRQNRPAL
jgi:hypothetical protein